MAWVSCEVPLLWGISEAPDSAQGLLIQLLESLELKEQRNAI